MENRKAEVIYRLCALCIVSHDAHFMNFIANYSRLRDPVVGEGGKAEIASAREVQQQNGSNAEDSRGETREC